MTPHDPRNLSVEEFRRRELQAKRGFPLAIMPFALGTLITGVIWVIAGSRRETLESYGLAATPAEIDEVPSGTSLEAEQLLGGAGLMLLGVMSAHLRSRTVQQR